MRSKRRVAAFLLAAAALAPASAGAEPRSFDGVAEALLGGRFYADLRYRLEHVDQAGVPREAEASTLRTVLGYETGTWHGFYLSVEAENVSVIGPERFNDTIDGRTDFPVVPDPPGTELNQLFLAYDVPEVEARVGRQRIKLDNERFIGAVGFRQNDQVFDAAWITGHWLPGVLVSYGYIDEVQRVFGSDSPVGTFESDTHLLHAALPDFAFGGLSVYGYLIDLENADAFSSQSYGARLTGERRLWFNPDLALTYAVEFAYQTDYGDNPSDYSATYLLLNPGIEMRNLAAAVGYERLGGDGQNSFQTPLATLHAFNGLTDQFVVTPPDGLEDLFATVEYTFDDAAPFESVALAAAYHEFYAAEGSLHYGNEWSAGVSFALTRRLSLALEHARYEADRFATDVSKTWLTLRVTF